LETYTDDDDDLSNAGTYERFLERLGEMARNAFRVLKPNSFACLRVASLRDRRTSGLRYIPGDTVRIFEAAGFQLHQEIICPRPKGSSALRAGQLWEQGKYLLPSHDNFMVFMKPGAG